MATTTPAKRIERITSSDGIEIYADAVGHPANPSVVFVHGFTLSAAAFDNIFEGAEFSQSYYLVRYDLRGHGRSGKPDNQDGYHSRLYAEDFQAVAKAFGLHRPVVVGWAIGGAVICDIASHLPPDTLAGAVYYNGVPYTGDLISIIATAELQAILPTMVDDSATATAASAAELAFTELVLRGANNSGGKMPWKIRCEWLGMAALQTPANRRFSLLREQDPTALLGLAASGSLPLLILCGAYDAVVKGEALVKAMRPLFKRLEVKIIEKGGSHSTHYENPDDFIDAIFKFAEELRISEECSRPSL